VVATAQIVMLLRVYAMSGRQKYILYGLSVWCFAQSVFSLIIIVSSVTGASVSGMKFLTSWSKVHLLIFTGSLVVPQVSLDMYNSNQRFMPIFFEMLTYLSLVCVVYARAGSKEKIGLAYICMSFGFDMVTIIATLTYGFKASRSLGSSKGLLRAVARDGILHFLFLFGMNLFLVLCILYARVSLIIH
jgi:hypothetical protein